MKDFLFRTLFKKQYEQAFENGMDWGKKVINQQKVQERELERKQELTGKLVISVGEGDVNPIIGYVVDWVDSVPVIDDIVTDSRMVCFGVTVPYSEKTLTILYKVSPCERYHLMAKRQLWCNPSMKTDVYLPLEEVLSKVQQRLQVQQ